MKKSHGRLSQVLETEINRVFTQVSPHVPGKSGQCHQPPILNKQVVQLIQVKYWCGPMDYLHGTSLSALMVNFDLTRIYGLYDQLKRDCLQRAGMPWVIRVSRYSDACRFHFIQLVTMEAVAKLLTKEPNSSYEDQKDFSQIDFSPYSYLSLKKRFSLVRHLAWWWNTFTPKLDDQPWHHLIWPCSAICQPKKFLNLMIFSNIWCLYASLSNKLTRHYTAIHRTLTFHMIFTVRKATYSDWKSFKKTVKFSWTVQPSPIVQSLAGTRQTTT